MRRFSTDATEWRLSWAMKLLRILVVMVAFIAWAAGPADAAEGESDPAIEDTINQGIALRRGGNDEAALGVFLDLEKSHPDSVRVLLHISTAALATGKWLMAYEYLQKASSHKDDAYYQRHLPAIDNVARAVGERVGQFRARGTPVGAEVRLSGVVVGTLPMNAAKPVEVGSYMLEVSQPGYFPLRRPITVSGHGSLTQESIDLTEQKPFSMSAAPGQVAIQQAQSSEVPLTGLRARWITWALAGAAVVAGTTSGIAFAIREQKASEWNDNSLNATCLSSTNQHLTREQACGSTVRHDIDLAQGVGIAAGVTAVAFAGAAVIHYVLSIQPDHPRERTPSPAIGLTGCSAGLGSVVCAGAF